ncbi:MAG: hypothetical protein AAFN92_13265, partial [Bacteroidota bacterium]
ESKISVWKTSPFFYSNGNLKILDEQTRNVYGIKGEKVALEYSLDFGKANVNVYEIPEKVRESVGGFMEYVKEEKKLFPFRVAHENDDKLIISAVYANSEFKTLVLDKKTGETRQYSLTGEHHFTPFAATIGDNHYGYFFNVQYARNALPNKHFVYDSLVLESNPVVFVYGDCL